MNFSLFVGVLLNWLNCRLLMQVYCWNDCRSRDILHLCERMQLS